LRMSWSVTPWQMQTYMAGSMQEWERFAFSTQMRTIVNYPARSP
jgi:hypothetical protein